MKNSKNFEKAKRDLGMMYIFRIASGTLIVLSTILMVLNPELIIHVIMLGLGIILLLVSQWCRYKYIKHMKDEK